MSKSAEILLTSDVNNSLWTCSIWDSHTGTNLMTYRGGGTAESKTLSLIGKDYIASIEKTKPILHIWPLNSHQTVQGMRFILPGKASAFAVSPDGAYCVAGIDEKIYLWQISSGNLLTIINRHYQKISLLKFMPEGRHFVSSAEDGMVMVWSLATVAANPEVELVTQSTAGQHDAVYIFSDHSLPVTDMCISKTGIHGRLSTVSSDRTCKIYDLSSGELLLNLVFDEPLSSITLDVLELSIFVGTTEGKIHQISLTNVPRNRDLLVNDIDNGCFSSHTKAVTCLSVSLNGEILVSGGNDEQIILWHIKSRQPVRIIRHKGPITNAFFTTNLDAIYKQDFSPNIILHSLERTLEENNEDVNEIEVLVNRKITFWPQTFSESVQNNIISKDIELDYKKNSASLEEQLAKLRTINANLYSLAVEKTLASAVQPVKKTKKKNKK